MSLIEKAASVTLRALTETLTGSFVSSAEVSVENASYVDLHIAYMKGPAATALELYIETLYEGDVLWYSVAAQSAGTPAAGAVAVTLNRPVYTVGATDAFVLPIPVFGARKLRVRARETGTPAGVAQVVAVASTVGA